MSSQGLIPCPVQMRYSFECSLLLFWTTFTFAISLASTLSLATPNLTDRIVPPSLTAPNSTNLNTSGELYPNPISIPGATCTKRHGEGLSVVSCRNAWQKIPRTLNVQWFIPRNRKHSRVSSDDVLMPIRYLSDDGICAIVR